MRTNFISSMIDCEQQPNGKWNAKPYREQVFGNREFMLSRIQYANEKGYRIDEQPDGSIVIMESDLDFLQRTQKKISDKLATAPP